MDSTEVEDFLKELLIYNSEEYITKIKEMITCALAYQGSFENLEKISIRREANVLTRLFFRDTDLEEAHATSSNEILTYDFVANLMDDSALELNEWLIMRDDLLEENPTFYYTIVKCCEIAKSSLMNWDQDPIIGKGNQPIKINEFNYQDYEIDTLRETLSDTLKDNTASFIENILQYCNGAIKKYQDDLDFIFDREIDEARVIAEYCFARSIPTDWYGKDMLTESNMKELMIFSSQQVTEWLIMRDTLLAYNEDFYGEIIYLLAAALDV